LKQQSNPIQNFGKLKKEQTRKQSRRRNLSKAKPPAQPPDKTDAPGNPLFRRTTAGRSGREVVWTIEPSSHHHHRRLHRDQQEREAARCNSITFDSN